MKVNEESLSRGLGWFCIGLGVAELIAPRRVGEAAGVRNHDNLLRAAGARQVISGVGILKNPRSAEWMWSRVAGDVMDISLLVKALSTARSKQDGRRASIALASVVGITALDVYCAVQLKAQNGSGDGRVAESNGRTRTHSSRRPLHTSITIMKPLNEVYAFWRNFDNLPRFMNHLKSVTVLDEKRSRWVAKGPAGSEVSWDAQITEEKPNEVIAWQSLPGATVDNAGTVRFETAPGNRGTIVRVELQYRAPGGVIGATIAKLFGEAPEKQIPVDLIRIKQLLETGEIARTEGQSAGRAKSTSRKYDDWLRT